MHGSRGLFLDSDKKNSLVNDVRIMNNDSKSEYGSSSGGGAGSQNTTPTSGSSGGGGPSAPTFVPEARTSTKRDAPTNGFCAPSTTVQRGGLTPAQFMAAMAPVLGTLSQDSAFSSTSYGAAQQIMAPPAAVPMVVKRQRSETVLLYAVLRDKDKRATLLTRLTQEGGEQGKAACEKIRFFVLASAFLACKSRVESVPYSPDKTYASAHAQEDGTLTYAKDVPSGEHKQMLQRKLNGMESFCVVTLHELVDNSLVMKVAREGARPPNNVLGR